MNEKTQNATTNSNPAETGASFNGADRYAETAHKGIDAAADAAHPAIDRMASGAHNAVDNADDVANHAAQAFNNAGVKGDELVTAGTNYMREHPLFTLGVAVTAGYVLSRLFGSR